MADSPRAHPAAIDHPAAAPRPAVDVVVPFRGVPSMLEVVLSRLATVRLRDGDSITLVDNSPNGNPPAATPAARTIRAPELQTPGFARNRGVEGGRAEWLVFLDADVLAPRDLVDRYFDPQPGERTAVLAGGIRDQNPASGRGSAAERYAHLRRSMSQEMTMQHGRWAFVQTANCACRREAFESVGGFREQIRAGEDADLCYRLKAAGWEIERRDGAEATHLNRRTVRALLSQKACHGAAAAWLDANYPGSLPARRRPGLVWWGVRRVATGLAAAARSRDREQALTAVLDPLTTLAFEFGRSLPNERPLLRRR